MNDPFFAGLEDFGPIVAADAGWYSGKRKPLMQGQQNHP